MNNKEELKNQIVDDVMKALDDIDLDEVAGGISQNIENHHKELSEAYKNLKEGKITQEEYDATVLKLFGNCVPFIPPKGPHHKGPRPPMGPGVIEPR